MVHDSGPRLGRHLPHHQRGIVQALTEVGERHVRLGHRQPAGAAIWSAASTW
ncbi:hypothetical protein ACIBP6_38375 [Nonomuraea terrae]|uniref:hypothetical protein n=1 Tax=Nonomuraea terrae TaxID=2530383 RepID=UPI00378DFDF6